MRITVISNSRNWCVEELIAACIRNNAEIDIVDFQSLYEGESFLDWGDAVILRNTNMDKIYERPFILNNIKKSSAYLMNNVLLERPLMINKSFQQNIVEGYIDYSGDVELKTIPTFRPKSLENIIELIDKNELKFPFIEKLDLDAQGKSVRKIERIEDVVFADNKIYQNFIDNDGDFRVLCLGGKVLGVMKRIAKSDDFRNNVSQGGRTEIVKDQEVLKEISGIAIKIASIFELDFCGVDIIYDKKREEYIFLEVNSYPWWQGFQTALKINVSDEIVKHCINLCDQKKDSYGLVKKYYTDNLDYLEGEKFHYASRLYLWSGEKKYKKELDRLKSEYIGENTEDTEKVIKKLLAKKEINYDINEIEIRMPVLKKYKNLAIHNKILFKVLFADSVFQSDIRSIADNNLDVQKMLAIKAKLERNDKDFAVLSTYAVNFIYTLENYLYKNKCPKDFINVEKYYKIAKNAYKGNLKDKNNLRVYLLTHCIIGESRFYSRKISRNKKTYLKMIKLAEQIISQNYCNMNLDVKLEFLVCTKILGYKTNLYEIVKSEAQNSLSHSGNYLIDKYNSHSIFKNKNGFKAAEHRNVLYLMAFGNNSRFANFLDRGAL